MIPRLLGDLQADGIQRVLVVGGILVVLFAAAAVAIRILVKRVTSSREAQPEAGFDPQGLEDLRSSGMLTSEELSRIRRKALGIAPGDGKAPEPPQAGQNGGTQK